MFLAKHPATALASMARLAYPPRARAVAYPPVDAWAREETAPGVGKEGKVSASSLSPGSAGTVSYTHRQL
ncbi:hypothetical protein, partial [Paenarthrobacter nicotinovorans]|uniref:hypothetical protein n=1 Tax=Paenarthrobacter nicotinovorans TaxID=29320 RepID=UPI0024859723